MIWSLIVWRCSFKPVICRRPKWMLLTLLLLGLLWGSTFNTMLGLQIGNWTFLSGVSEWECLLIINLLLDFLWKGLINWECGSLSGMKGWQISATIANPSIIWNLVSTRSYPMIGPLDLSESYSPWVPVDYTLHILKNSTRESNFASNQNKENIVPPMVQHNISLSFIHYLEVPNSI